MPQPPRNSLEPLARAGRQAIRRLWSSRDELGRLQPAEKDLLELLEMHPEFERFWEGEEPEPDQNPFLHIGIHEVIERQVADHTPPEAARAVDRLLARGLDRHEAIHRVMTAFVFELSAAMHGSGEFDDTAYRTRLERLAAGD